MTRADVLIGLDLDVAADEVFDAAGKWVIPGGIDGHTHMELLFGGTFAKDTPGASRFRPRSFATCCRMTAGQRPQQG